MKKQETIRNNAKKAVNSGKTMPESKGKYLKERKPKKVVRERLRHDANMERLSRELADAIKKYKYWTKQADESHGLDHLMKSMVYSALNPYGVALCNMIKYESLKPRAKNGKPLHRTPEEIAEFERFVGLSYPNNKKERKA